MKIGKIVVLSCVCFALIAHTETVFAVNVWVYNTTRFPLKIAGVVGSSYGVCNWPVVQKGAAISRGCFFQPPESHRLICIRPIQQQFAFQFDFQIQCEQMKTRTLTLTVSNEQGSFQILGQTYIVGCSGFGDTGVWATFKIQNQQKNLYGSLVSGYQNLYIYVGNNNTDISQYGQTSVSLQTNERDQCNILPH